jgi:hypothetical protein
MYLFYFSHLYVITMIFRGISVIIIYYYYYYYVNYFILFVSFCFFLHTRANFVVGLWAMRRQ